MSVVSTVAPTVSVETNYTLGAELLNNPDMSSDTGWTKGAGWLFFTNAYLTFGNAAGALSQSVTTVDGDEYRIEMQIGATAGRLDVRTVDVNEGGAATFKLFDIAAHACEDDNTNVATVFVNPRL